MTLHTWPNGKTGFWRMKVWMSDVSQGKAHQKRPEPLGMLLSVRVLNLETDTVASAAASRAMRFWDRFTGSTASHAGKCQALFIATL